eukprot:COSAG05_NODE_1135_length_5760_cov_9.624448_5_plen_61_part_00
MGLTMDEIELIGLDDDLEVDAEHEHDEEDENDDAIDDEEMALLEATDPAPAPEDACCVIL